jgi:hypothetical protein
MHSRSIGLEGEEQFRSCKRKLNTMIGYFQDLHQHDKMNFFVPRQSDSISM